MGYNPNIPQPTDELADSQGDILTNFSAANTSSGINHYPFDNLTVNNGKHKYVQIPLKTTPPTSGTDEWTVFTQDFISGSSTTNELFVSPPGADYALGAYPLTASAPGFPQNLAAGTSFLPGGLYLQWGKEPFPGTSNPSGTVNFTANFPNNCLMVQLTLQGNVATSASNTVEVVGTPTNTSFNWSFTGSTSYDSFYWFAIGN